MPPSTRRTRLDLAQGHVQETPRPDLISEITRTRRLWKGGGLSAETCPLRVPTCTPVRPEGGTGRRHGPRPRVSGFTAPSGLRPEAPFTTGKLGLRGLGTGVPAEAPGGDPAPRVPALLRPRSGPCDPRKRFRSGHRLTPASRGKGAQQGWGGRRAGRRAGVAGCAPGSALGASRLPRSDVPRVPGAALSPTGGWGGLSLGACRCCHRPLQWFCPLGHWVCL